MEICLIVFALLALAGMWWLSRDSGRPVKDRKEALDEFYRQVDEIDRENRGDAVRGLVFKCTAVLLLVFLILLAVSSL